MSPAATGQTWDQSTSPTATRLARQFESAWRSAAPGSPRPDPLAFLSDAPEHQAGTRLALLRAELTLRWEAGDHSPVSEFLARYRDLDEDTIVALIYEEFCLREEEQDRP